MVSELSEFCTMPYYTVAPALRLLAFAFAGVWCGPWYRMWYPGLALLLLLGPQEDAENKYTTSYTRTPPSHTYTLSAGFDAHVQWRHHSNLA